MEIIVTTLEIIGAIAFAVSGALVGIRKNMDVFGVCVLGLSTAVGGGVIRDLILGETPPAMFTNPIYAIAGLATCLFVLIPEIRTMVERVPPYIFTKHVYAVASIAGGILLCVIYPYVDKYIGLFITSAFVVVLRLLASRFRWEIPKAEDVSLHHTKNHSGKE